MKAFKILHITDLHLRHNGRLFYSTGKKINNGLILNGHNVLNISDRDLTSGRKNLFDIGSKKFLLDQIIKNIENFKPDIILLGHVDRLNYENFLSIKEKYNSIKFGQWFLDPLVKIGPDFEKNKNRFFLKYQFCDANFITTSVNALNFVNNDKTFFIPNPIDRSIDKYQNFKSSKPLDMFIAISHGQHRGILKKDFIDDRVKLINQLTKKISCNVFGYKNNPVWGQSFFDELSKCSMAINLSRGEPIKYYSSDRISSLIGNGLLTFVDAAYQFDDFFDKNEMIFYYDIEDLNEKLKYFKSNDTERIQISEKGYLKGHKIFNNKLITNFMINKIFNFKSTFEHKWMN